MTKATQEIERASEPTQNVSQEPIDLLLKRLGSSENGLTSQEAQKRLIRDGANEPAPTHGLGGAVQILRFFLNPLVIILLVASAVSAKMGDVVSAVFIVGIVFVSVALNFVQTFHSQRAADKLRDGVAPTASVKRDGEWRDIKRREIVTGDIVRLAAGDLTPADARIIESRDLHIQQAALTGESMPVEKEANTPKTAPATLTESENLVFLGTSAVSGAATAVVFATGRNTAFGDIAARLTKRPPETEFERGTRKFGMLIMQTVFVLVMFIMTFRIALKRDPMEALLFSVALAVGLTPEFLPMIITVTLGQGAIRMARK